MNGGSSAANASAWLVLIGCSSNEPTLPRAALWAVVLRALMGGLKDEAMEDWSKAESALLNWCEPSEKTDARESTRELSGRFLLSRSASSLLPFVFINERDSSIEDAILCRVSWSIVRGSGGMWVRESGVSASLGLETLSFDDD